MPAAMPSQHECESSGGTRMAARPRAATPTATGPLRSNVTRTRPSTGTSSRAHPPRPWLVRGSRGGPPTRTRRPGSDRPAAARPGRANVTRLPPRAVGRRAPDDRDAPAEQRARLGQVARRDGRPDVGAADRPSVERERRRDLDLEARPPRRARPRVAGVPRRSWPNAASGVMRKPASSVRARIRSMNASYGVSRSASSKCWTTVTSTPAAARRSSRSSGSHRSGGAAPTRISSG